MQYAALWIALPSGPSSAAFITITRPAVLMRRICFDYAACCAYRP